MSHTPDPLDALANLGQAQPTSAARERIRAGAWAQIQTPQRNRVPWVAALAASVSCAAAVFFWPAANTTRTIQPRPELVSIGNHQISKDPGTTMTVVNPDPQATVVRLEAGRAEFAIEPLDGGFFKIQAPRARVEVIGTKFTVDVGLDCTEIRVSEGKVRVTGQDRVLALTANEQARFCASFADAGASVSTSANTANAGRPETVPEVPVAAVAPEVGVAGEALIHGALDRIGRGVALDAAAGDLEHYLERWPDGLFVEEAMFHAALLAQRRKAADARDLAQRFQKRFPGSRRVERLREALTQ